MDIPVAMIFSQPSWNKFERGIESCRKIRQLSIPILGMKIDSVLLKYFCQFLDALTSQKMWGKNINSNIILSLYIENPANTS